MNLSPEEKRVYGLVFHQADTESVGVVTGEVAVQFFEKTRLDSRILGEVSPSIQSFSPHRHRQQASTGPRNADADMTAC